MGHGSDPWQTPGPERSTRSHPGAVGLRGWQCARSSQLQERLKPKPVVQACPLGFINYKLGDQLPKAARRGKLGAMTYRMCDLDKGTSGGQLCWGQSSLSRRGPHPWEMQPRLPAREDREAGAISSQEGMQTPGGGVTVWRGHHVHGRGWGSCGGGQQLHGRA